MVGGEIAVQAFYMISGYLMSFILVEKKSYPSLAAFYANRALRLFPIYYVVLLLALSINVVGTAYTEPPFFETVGAIDIPAMIVLLLSNIFIIGQDVVMFLAYDDGLHFTRNFRESDPLLFRGLLIPQAWTLSLELAFYLIAPFVLPRPKLLISLFLTSALVKIYLISTGLGLQDPWSYRFFPSELSFFLVGALVHQGYNKYIKTSSLPAMRGGPILLVLVAASIFSYPLFSSELSKWVFLALVLCSLPALLQYQRENPIDNAIGELSYPVYICHMALLSPFNFLLKKTTGYGGDSLLISAFFVIIVLGFSWGLNRVVGQRVEKIRASIKFSRAAAS